MHMANQKHRQYPSGMIQVALEKDDLTDEFRPRRFEIRGVVSPTAAKSAADEEDTKSTWMCTAECVAWIVSRLEEELAGEEKDSTDNAAAATATTTSHNDGDESLSEVNPSTCKNQSLYQILMKPLDEMVDRWKAFVSAPKNRKHDIERGLSRKEKRRRRQQQERQQQSSNG
jgi:hypothetical protein